MAAHKSKKCTVQFSDGLVDNTAPIEKIFDNIFYKNYQAYELYTMTLKQRLAKKGKLKNYHHSILGHPLYAFHEEWDGDLKNEYFENFNYKSLMPFFITPLVNTNQPDPVTESMRKKMDWLHQCQKYFLIANYGTAPKYECLNEEVVHCPQMMVDMAAHLERDPDPYFDEVYNWYYAGNGNLHLMTINQIDYLLHSHFHYSYVSEFSKDDLTIKKQNICSFDCGSGNNILETIFTENTVVLRTIKKIFVVKVTISDNEQVVMEAMSVLESDKPFVGINFDSFHKNILYISSIENEFKIVNLDRMKCRTVNTDRKDFPNNWNTIIGCERMTYMLIDRDSINFYDKRTNTRTHRWDSLRMITDEKNCNHITAAKAGTDSSSLYVLSDHHLFLIDIREAGRARAVQRWTHGMQCAPTYMASCMLEGSEFLCLGSQWAPDTCVLPATAGRAAIPRRLPSVLDVLDEAREMRTCWDFYNPIEDRISAAVTGLEMMQLDEKYVVLMHNSLGDISSHVIYPEYMEMMMEDDSVGKFQQWSSHFKAIKKDFKVSTVEDIACILKKMKQIPSNHIILGGTTSYSNFNQEEVDKAFASNEVDSALLDAWKETT